MSRIIATWFGAGYLPWAPGTWGSLAALVPGVALIAAGGTLALAIATVLISAVGWWASSTHAATLRKEDPGEIVVDEVAGQWIALLPAGLGWPDIVAAFILFRAADILKPWPASWADRTLPGGLGIMADDWIAGLYAALGLIILQQGGLL